MRRPESRGDRCSGGRTGGKGAQIPCKQRTRAMRTMRTISSRSGILSGWSAGRRSDRILRKKSADRFPRGRYFSPNPPPHHARLRVHTHAPPADAGRHPQPAGHHRPRATHPRPRAGPRQLGRRVLEGRRSISCQRPPPSAHLRGTACGRHRPIAACMVHSDDPEPPRNPWKS